MTYKKPGHHLSHSRGAPPNPLGFRIKDPLGEAYEGRWNRLPVVQRVGMAVVLGFWVLVTIFVVWSESGEHPLIGLLPLGAIITILLVFSVALGRSVQ